MPRTQADSPFVKWGNSRSDKATRERKAATHDPLCITRSGLGSCWCKCARCWDPYGRCCICYDCSCRRAQG